MVNCLSIYVSIFSYSLYRIWFIMELNLLSFVALIWEFQDVNESSSKAIIKYFSIQAFSSVLFLIRMLLILLTNSKLLVIATLISILIKLGIAPFHLWIISMGAKVNYLLLLWLLIPQKIIPLSILSNLSYISNLIIGLSLIFRTLHSLTQTKIKKIIIISSVFSINWIYLTINIRNNMWLLYFITYSLISLSVILLLSNDLSSILISGFINKTLINQKLMVILLLIISGIPPRPIFFLKIRIVYYLSKTRWALLLLIMICSILIIYIYINSLLYSRLISNKSYSISFVNNSNSTIIPLVLVVISLIVILLF